jgi:hypothetical protein
MIVSGRSRFGIGFVGLSVIAGAALCPGGARAATPEKVGRAVVITGQVDLLIAGKATRMKTGDSLFAGSVVKTGADARAKLLFEDRTVIDLGTKSEFKIEEFKLGEGANREVTFAMGDGKVRSNVTQPLGSKGRFTIRTKAASMGVRGTEFIVLSEPVRPGAPEVKTQVTVLEGRVEVKDRAAPNAQAYSVSQGQQYNAVAQVQGDRAIAASGGESPKVVDLSQSQLAAATADVKIEDKSFKEPEKAAPKQDAAPGPDAESKTEAKTEGKSEAKSESKPETKAEGGGAKGGREPAGKGESGGGMATTIMAAVRDAVQTEIRAPAFNAPPPPPPRPPGFSGDPLQNTVPLPQNLQDSYKLRVVFTKE